MDNQICPECGYSMKRGVQPLTLRYKEASVTFDMPGWYCEGCSEAIHTGKDMQESDHQLKLMTDNHLEQPAARGDRDKFERVLAKVPSVSPDAQDALE
jgi:YgiT-type zinc finger domain-containing protein